MAHTVERAFELARSGECASMADIRCRLRRERREQVDLHLAGRLIREQLRQALAEGARAVSHAPLPGSLTLEVPPEPVLRSSA